MTALERFLSKVEATSFFGCWVWTGAISNTGYSAFVPAGRGTQTTGHRWAYEYVFGPIEPDRQLHHACGTRTCVSPLHVVVVTREQHGKHHRVDVCRRGHPFTPENTLRNSDGHRQCRTCWRVANRRASATYREKRRAS